MKYFKCIKDFKMSNGERRHEKGIIYPKHGAEMPAEGQNQHAFDEKSSLFKKHFEQVSVSVGKPAMRMSVALSDALETVKECRKQLDIVIQREKDLEETSAQVLDRAKYWEKKHFELSQSVGEINQQSLNRASKINMLENELERANKIIDKLV